MYRVLVLDDDELRHQEFDKILRGTCHARARSSAEAIEILSSSPPFDVVFLDHDLDLSPEVDHGSGLDVARYVASMEPGARPRLAYVHSHNAPRAAQMAWYLRRAGVKTVVRPFHL
jgi:CheY-like chemotaxis protein